MEREGAAVTCDVRLFHGGATETGNALSPTVDRRVRRTSGKVDEAERKGCSLWNKLPDELTLNRLIQMKHFELC